VVEPLGLYFRPGRNDHTTLSQVLSMGPPSFSGVVMDASLEARHRELRLQLPNVRAESVLDPMTLELATPGGWERPALRALPWAGETQHHPTGVSARGSQGLVEPLARFALGKRYSALVAPTHFLEAGVQDPWWRIDRRLTEELRRQLDAAGAKDFPIYYRLAVARLTLMDRKQRSSIVAALMDLDIDAVWLCLHPVDARRSGPNVVKSYVDLCSEFARVGKPLIAERTGFLGTTLLGLNAVGGIESGITFGEGFNAGRLMRRNKPKEKHFAARPRVYLASLGVFLDPPDAKVFFAKARMKRRFGCQGRPCCRSPEDMLRDPRRHLVFTRAAEVSRIMGTPAQHRPTMQLESIRKASDDAVHASKVDSRFTKDRERLDGWRLALSGLIERNEHSRVAAAPPRGRVRHRKSA
jgi:hypothetical protein